MSLVEKLFADRKKKQIIVTPIQSLIHPKSKIEKKLCNSLIYER